MISAKPNDTTDQIVYLIDRLRVLCCLKTIKIQLQVPAYAVDSDLRRLVFVVYTDGRRVTKND